MKYLSFCILMSCYTVTSSAQVDTLSYSYVVKGKITGGGKDWQIGTNEHHSTFKFNDRGRGDSTVSVFYTDSAGRITSLAVSGVDYYKNPYNKTFTITGDSAVWIINGERKAKKYTNQIYPADNALLIKWLLKQDGKRGEIIPDGFIHLGNTLERSFIVNGKHLGLKMIPIYDEPSPLQSYVWMTSDLKFFADVRSWKATIMEGYEGLVDTLFAMQELASEPYYADELKNNSRQLPTHILLTHASLFDSETASVKKDMTIEVRQGKITAIYKSLPATKLKHGDTVIDCKGKFLMPGLWDMHGHYQKDDGSFYLAGGVTHVRDMGNGNITLTYKQQIQKNKLLGPDLTYMLGFIDKEDPFQAPTGKIVKSLEEAIKAVEEYHQLGYQAVKLYSAIKPEWVMPIAAKAHKFGMRVTGHVPAFMTAEQAINAGYDEITHMNFIFLNFMGDTIDTRTPTRFRAVGDNSGSLDLKSKKVRSFIELMKRKNISLDATMNVWQNMFDEFKSDTLSYMKPIVKWLPEQWLSYIVIKNPFGSEQQKANYKAAFNNMLSMLKLLYDNDILLVAGTDGGTANALHHELELYVKAGIPPNQVLKIATYNAAKNCKLQNIYGSVKVGRSADFILIDGDPVSDISDVRRIELVIKNNLMFQPKQLLAAQGWNYYY